MEREYHSEEEVRRAFARLRPLDLVRLGALARNWTRRAPQRDSDDLLNEAISRVLRGRRPWPVDVPLSAFLSGVMRSIASQWADEDRDTGLAEDEIVGGVDALVDQASVDHEKRDLLGRMRLALLDDTEALGVFDQMLRGTLRADARQTLEMDEQQYDTARRRMTRNLLHRFGPGWKE